MFEKRGVNLSTLIGILQDVEKRGINLFYRYLQDVEKKGCKFIGTLQDFEKRGANLEIPEKSSVNL